MKINVEMCEIYNKNTETNEINEYIDIETNLEFGSDP